MATGELAAVSMLRMHVQRGNCLRGVLRFMNRWTVKSKCKSVVANPVGTVSRLRQTVAASARLAWLRLPFSRSAEASPRLGEPYQCSRSRHPSNLRPRPDQSDGACPRRRPASTLDHSRACPALATGSVLAG